eukprot:4090-Heterococcus_DN1.PRE.1
MLQAFCNSSRGTEAQQQQLTAAEQVLSRQYDATLKATTTAEHAALFGGLRCRSAAEGRRKTSVAYVSQHNSHTHKAVLIILPYSLIVAVGAPVDALVELLSGAGYWPVYPVS